LAETQSETEGLVVGYVGYSDDVVALGENWSQLDSVTLLRSVIEIATTGINSIVAEVIEDYEVARDSL
jgi:hypothetical protein